jgi:hypothetical protein
MIYKKQEKNKMPILSETFLRADRVEIAVATCFIKGVEFDMRPGAYKAYSKAVLNPPEDRREDDSYYSECVAIHLLVDIRNLLNDDKTPFIVTKESKIKLLKEYSGIGTKILMFSSEPSNFVEANKLDEEMGNSEASLPGK